MNHFLLQLTRVDSVVITSARDSRYPCDNRETDAQVM